MHLVLCAIIATFVFAPVASWESCGIEDGGGLCPDGNTCCSVGNVPGKSSCITQKKNAPNNMTSSCCTDDGMGMTGCGPGYRCVHEVPDSYFCEIVPDDEERLGTDEEQSPIPPQRLPRYRLCSVPPASLQKVHGLIIGSMNNKNTESTNTSGQLAYYSTMGSLDATDAETLFRHAKVRVALIMIHGSGRNADDYICCGVSSIPKEFSSTSVLVVAPRFLAPRDGPVNITATMENGQHPPPLLEWNETDPIPHTWRYGANAINSEISSYDAMDTLLERLVLDNDRFPLLERVVVAGHSAGGQFTHRWSLTSSSQAWARDNTNYAGTLQRQVLIRVVVANPRSFCYLDGRRYVNGSLALPDHSTISACPGYNTWEWGLDSGGRLPTPYKDRALDTVGGKKQMIERYNSRDVVYLAGALDVEPVRSECEDDDFQGPNRRERSKRFFASLNEIYGANIHHRRLLVSGVPHDHCLMFQSAEGRIALFGNDRDVAITHLIN